MMHRMAVSLGAIAAFAALSSSAGVGAATPSKNAAAEYAQHFPALSQLSIAVAKAMPADKYGFRPHPESMTFGELISHIASTNYQFCAGLKNSNAPALPPVSGKAAIVQSLSDSFAYCSTAINGLTEEQLNATHNSPDGRLPGRGLLLAMYVHVAHHRGQAEIYLRDNGIRPPGYRV